MSREGPEFPGWEEECEPLELTPPADSLAGQQGPKKLSRAVQALLQSLFVAAYVLVVFLVVYRFGSKLAMASLAASAFIAFGLPAAESGRPRYLIGVMPAPWPCPRCWSRAPG